MGNRLRKKSFSAVCLLLVSAVLLGSVSYAWLVLSARPEVADVNTVIGANGNLEIALATTEHLRQLQENDMYEPEGAEFVMANGDAVHDNVLWGNLVDVMSADYGLYTLDMRPAMLNVVDGAVAEVPVSLAGYGADGRMEAFDMDRIDIRKIGMSAVFDKEKARPVAGTVTMDRASLEAGIIDKDAVLQNLLDNVQYGVRVAGPLTYNGSYDLQSENITVDLVVDGYCFALDLLVRTNAPVANLMLQTEGALRVQTDDELLLEDYQGQGSFIDLQNPLMTAALNVVFADTLTGKVYAVAQPNPEDGKLWITLRADENGELVATPPEDSAMILPLTQNRVTALTAWVFLNGNLVQNASAMTRNAMELLMNLQFSTDAVLNPAYTDENAEHTYSDRPEFSVPTLPSVPGESGNPSAPVNPSDPIEVGTFYLESKDNGHYSIYALDDNGSRTYDTDVIATVNGTSGAVTVNAVRDYSAAGIVIPAVVEDAQSGAKYDVKLNPSAFADVKNAAVPVHVLEVDGKKVVPTGASLYEMFRDGAYTSIDLRGLDTSNVTDMGRMFWSCANLTSLNIGGLDTRNATSMAGMFTGCSSLTSLDVSGFETGKVTDMNGMFSSCMSLTSLDVSGFDTGNVTNMSGMFAVCNSVKRLDVSGFETGNVTDMGTMFHNCNSLTSLDVSGFDTGNVTNMYLMFYQCNRLTSLDLSSFDMTNAANTEMLVRNCTGLEKIVSPKAMGSASVELYDSYRCAANGSVYTVLDQTVPAKAVLTKVNGDEPVSTDTYYLEARNDGNYSIYRLNSDGSRAVDTGVEATVDQSARTMTVNSVRDCTDAGIVIPAVVEDAQSGTKYDVKLNPSAFANVKEKAVTVSVVEVDGKKVEPTGTNLSEMFRESKYTSIDLRGFDTSNVTNMGQMFCDCRSLISLDVSGFNTGKVTDMSKMFYMCHLLVSLDVCGFDTENVADMNNMFWGCENLTSLDVSGFDTSNVTDMKYMFHNCGGLTELDVSGFKTSNVTNMRSMFYGCGNLTSLDVSGFETDNVTDMSWMFVYCKSLTNLDVSGFNTAKVTRTNAMFQSCSGVTTLEVSGFDTRNVMSMGDMFQGCSGLTSLDVSGFDTSNVTSMYAMFLGCKNLTELDVSGFDTGNVEYMGYMFKNCSKLTEIDVSNFNTVQAIDMANMFENCSNLSSLDVSSFDTRNVTDMSYMFSNCTGLKTMNLQNFNTSNVTDMSYMFSGCKNVTDWYIADLDTSSVTNMSHTFHNCTYLRTNRNLYFDTSNVTDMSYLFYGCALTVNGTLDLTNLDVSKVTDMSYMFANTCPVGGTLDISNWDLSGVDTTGMFSGCGASVIRPA